MTLLSSRTGLALLLAIGVPGIARAQTAPTRANTSNLFLGLDANAAWLSSSDIGGDSDIGAGMTLRIGYGFTSAFALFFEVAATQIHEVGVGHADFGARWHFATPSRAFVPYVEGALSVRALVEDNYLLVDNTGQPQLGEFAVSGSAFSVGGGVLFYFTPKWALNTELKWSSGEFTTVRFNDVSVSGLEIDATSTRLNIGISWFPMTRR